MLDFAIQNLETLKVITFCFGLAGLATMVASWLLRRRLGAFALRLGMIGLALQSVFPATSDYRGRLDDIVFARKWLQLAQSAGDTALSTEIARDLAKANAALGDLSVYALIFGLAIIGALLTAIWPQWMSMRPTEPEAAA